MRHLISVDDLTNDEIDVIFYEADKLRNSKNQQGGKILATFFYEPSTRTRLSFECAAHKLGMNILSVPDADCSSSAKGESLEDTIKTVAELSDILVLRHHINGAAKIASEVSKIPVINAGDGSGEHPSQALLDLYTIQKKFGSAKRLNILFMGDLDNARTAKSLKRLLLNYTKGEINIWENNNEDFYQKLTLADVLYVVRDQVERWNTPLWNMPLSEDYLLKRKKISLNDLDLMKKDSIIMHPLPRKEEIDPAIDSDKRVVFFEQINNGLYVRMSVINFLLNNI